MTWINNRELKIYLLVVGAVALIALLITFIVLLPGYIRYNKSIVQNTQIPENSIDMSKFMIPESYKKIWESSWAYFIEDKDKWSSADIEPYWNDPKELVLKYLEEQNENYIDEIFKDIP